jgi:aminoglycoside phosphotransferase (APT) family kinase protein
MSAVVSIPRYPGDVTPEWLSTVLSERHPSVKVSDVDVVAIGTGQTGATYRVTARYLTDPGDLPQTFVIKLPAQDDTVRDRVVIGYRSECAFYASVADRVQVPTPQCFYCEITEDAMDFALLLADQAPAVQGDQLAGCGEQEARLAVNALAGLHAPSWCDPVWLNFPGLAFRRPDAAGAGGMGEVARMSAEITLEKLGERMTAEDRETFRTAMGLVEPWLLAEYNRFALLHGDYRLDNMLFDPDRTRVSVVDWQTLGVGLPARDLAYFTATSLNSRLRASIEEDLVADYHRALSDCGVAGYDRETCWRDYRLGVLQAPLISALGFAFAATTERGDDMVLAMLSRGCQAIRELGTLELLG